MPAATITTMADGLFRLLALLSPAFPTGGFAYSHGLEWAVEAGDVRSEAELFDWLSDLLHEGSGRSDTILLRLAWRAEDAARLRELGELALACAPARERRAETLDQGTAFGVALTALLPAEAAMLPAGLPYPVAIGAAARAAGIAEDAAALGYLHAWLANLISAGVRLIPLGQSAGLRVLAKLEAPATRIAHATRGGSEHDLGGACFRADLSAMKHETQYTRLFRT